jgi:pimeloyl-ACP methyl ester carboxylesterase
MQRRAADKKNVEAMAYVQTSLEEAMGATATRVRRSRSTCPGGGSALGAYFLDLRGYRPAQLAASLPCPPLVMQGGRDYQVTTDDDFASWRTALRGAPNATLKWYASLDHRFVSGSGRSWPAQYEEPGHVDVAIIDDIAAWMHSTLPRSTFSGRTP